MIENEMNDREQMQQALRPAQAAPVRRADSIKLLQNTEAHSPCAEVEASFLFSIGEGPKSIPFAGDDAE